MSNWAFVCLSEILTESKIIDNCPDPDRKIRVKLNCNGVEKRPLMSEKEGATKNYVRKSGQFIYGKQNFHKGAFGVIPTELDGFSSSGDLPAFDVDSRCLPEWIYYWFKTDNRYLQLAKHAKGVGSQRVNVDSFLKEEIALPSLNLQAKIIGNINNSSFTLKSLSVESQNQSSYLTKLRQAILQEAIEGKLTVDWRKENPVRKGDPDYDSEALLVKIQAEKEKLIKKGKIKKQKPLAPIKAEEVPFELPVGWVWTRLGEISEGFQYGSSVKSLKDGKVPVLRMGNIQDGKIDWNGLVYTNNKNEIEQYVLKKGDLLFNRTNSRELVGKTAVFDGLRDAIFAGYLVRFSPLAMCSSEYFNFIMNSTLHREWCKQNKTDAIGQSNINATKLRDFLFPLAPLAEQQAIVDHIEKLLTMVDELEKQVSERKEQSEQLMQAVLREAFEGGNHA